MDMTPEIKEMIKTAYVEAKQDRSGLITSKSQPEQATDLLKVKIVAALKASPLDEFIEQIAAYAARILTQIIPNEAASRQL